jgi:hypothetical protein
VDFLHVQYTDFVPYWRYSKARTIKRIYLKLRLHISDSNVYRKFFTNNQCFSKLTFVASTDLVEKMPLPTTSHCPPDFDTEEKNDGDSFFFCVKLEETEVMLVTEDSLLPEGAVQSENVVSVEECPIIVDSVTVEGQGCSENLEYDSNEDFVELRNLLSPNSTVIECKKDLLEWKSPDRTYKSMNMENIPQLKSSVRDSEYFLDGSCQAEIQCVIDSGSCQTLEIQACSASLPSQLDSSAWAVCVEAFSLEIDRKNTIERLKEEPASLELEAGLRIRIRKSN